MKRKKNILLCVAGVTPQIITETLYALTQQKSERIDEIRVITTYQGFDKIMTGVVKGEVTPDESLLYPKEGQFYKFLEHYPDVGKIKFDRTRITLLESANKKTLEDIRTPEDNALAGDKICQIVAELCKDKNTRIHASAAGGRKTMGIYLTAAMQLFGRADDSLSHVLVNEDFESGLAPKFFYPPPEEKPIILRDGREVTTADARIYLAPVPFIRLRGIGVKAFDASTKNYHQAVKKAQTNLRLAESINELRFDLKRLIIKVADRQIKLTLREMFVYTLFAYFKKAGIGENGFVGLKDITREDLDSVCSLFFAARRRNLGFDDFIMLPKSDFINRLDKREAKKILLKRKEKRFFNKNARPPKDKEIIISQDEVQNFIVKNLREILGKAEPKIKAVLTPEDLFSDFYITRGGVKEAYIFGFNIDADRIKFDHQD